jgi:hypothetical protein
MGSGLSIDAADFAKSYLHEPKNLAKNHPVS